MRSRPSTIAISIGFTNISTATPARDWAPAHQTGWTGLVAKLIQQQGTAGTIVKRDPFTDL